MPRASVSWITRGSRVDMVAFLLFSPVQSYSMAVELLARSRNWNFWILPVLVLGIGSKRISRGTL